MFWPLKFPINITVRLIPDISQTVPRLLIPSFLGESLVGLTLVCTAHVSYQSSQTLIFDMPPLSVVCLIKKKKKSWHDY